MRVLVIGGGGREHALVWKIKQSPKVQEIFCAPGNAGTSEMAENVSIAADDIDGLLKFAIEKDIGLTVVGPEQPLVKGIVDRFEEKGLRIFGPNARAAELEGSKSFSKDIMKKYGLPTAEYQTFTSARAAEKYIQDKNCPLVVKADGLAAGKGVLLCQTAEEALAAVDSIMQKKSFGEAGDQIVVEEFLQGQEISVLAFSDGQTVLLMDSAQDHKAAFDGDKGPNTGGMGAYSPASIVNETVLKKVKEEVYDRTLAELKKRGITYKGVLYAGLMIENDQPSVVEFNCRFGDPETQAVLARWDGDMLPAINGVIDGNLSEDLIEWKDEHSVCVVMVAGGYPGDYAKGNEVQNIAKANAVEDTFVFHAGTALDGDKVVTAGGRVLGITSLGTDLPDALSKAYIAVETISFKDAFYRNDIAHRELRRLENG